MMMRMTPAALIVTRPLVAIESNLPLVFVSGLSFPLPVVGIVQVAVFGEMAPWHSQRVLVQEGLEGSIGRLDGSRLLLVPGEKYLLPERG